MVRIKLICCYFFFKQDEREARETVKREQDEAYRLSLEADRKKVFCKWKLIYQKSLVCISDSSYDWFDWLIDSCLFLSQREAQEREEAEQVRLERMRKEQEEEKEVRAIHFKSKKDYLWLLAVKFNSLYSVP